MHLTTLVLPLLLQATAPQEKPFPLMVGDPAPAIQVAEWVQGTPLTAFEKGRVHVVEFWATWCGPCRYAIPHLNELQEKYRDSVRFVGVTVWEHLDREPYSVPAFVKEMGDQMTYTVASDRTEDAQPARMADSWMKAAGRRGIPSAFIVDGEGNIAWIGHPMKIDQPLADIVAGKWDMAAAAAEYARELKAEAAKQKIAEEVAKAKEAGDWNGAVAAIDRAVAEFPSLEAQLGVDRYFLLSKAARAAEATTYGQRLVAEVYAKTPGALNALAWGIIDPEAKIENPDVKLAVSAAERAVELTESKDPNVLDTLGLALFLAGDVARAIEIQEQAVSLAKGSGSEPEMKKRLEQFRAKGAQKGS